MTVSPHYKVLITTPVLLIGGTEIQTFRLIKVLLSAGYDVSVCCYHEYESSVVRQIEGTGAKVILMGLPRAGGMLTILVELRKLFKKLSPNILHVQYLAPGLIPIIAARLAGVKRVFATVHQPGKPYGLKAKLLIRIAAYLCDVFFCNSRSVEESWFGDSQIFDPNKSDRRRKHYTIYNGVDVDRIDKVTNETDNKSLKGKLNIESKKVVGVVGRLRGEKGQATLLESMKTAIQELPDAVLIVVGDGPDRQYLEGLAKKLGIDGHVKWLGQKDHDEVLRLYSVMDVVVVPSLFEGFGLTAAEAMAAARPVVASSVDGLTELVENGVTGLLVPPGEKNGLSQALVRVLSEPARAALMGARGREFIEKNFSLERFQSTILAVYSHFSQT